MTPEHESKLRAGRESVAARAGAVRDHLSGLGALADALEDLAAAIRHHGSEADTPEGTLAVVLERAPRLEPAVDDLRADHRRLPAALGGLAVQVRDLAEDVGRQLADLERHRETADHLFYEAFDTDIGGGG